MVLPEETTRTVLELQRRLLTIITDFHGTKMTPKIKSKPSTINYSTT